MRHPVLLSLWAILVALTGLSLTSSGWFVLVFLASPFVALATLAAVFKRREVEVFRDGWARVYRLASGGLALAAGAGVIASAATIVDTGAGTYMENGPLAFLFFLAFMFAWPATTRPSPRRAAAPATPIHLTWLPLVIINALNHSNRADVAPGWMRTTIHISLFAILGLSAILAMLSLVAFDGEAKVATATART